MDYELSRFSKMLNVAAHPYSLTFATFVSILLWMPFGFGYYDYPYGNPFAVCILATFVFSFPIAAWNGFLAACEPPVSLVRIGVSIISMLVAPFGMLHFIFWVVALKLRQH